MADFYDKFIKACKKPDVIALDRLLRSTKEIKYPLICIASLSMACYHGHSHILDVVLKDGRIDPTLDNHDCVYSAIRGNNLHTILLLLNDKRINPNFRGGDLLDCAKSIGNQYVISSLEVLIAGDKYAELGRKCKKSNISVVKG